MVLAVLCWWFGSVESKVTVPICRLASSSRLATSTTRVVITVGLIGALNLSIETKLAELAALWARFMSRSSTFTPPLKPDKLELTYWLTFGLSRTRDSGRAKGHIAALATESPSLST